uniref:TMEM131_like domain-containing protein n=1 Tax=Syphacia muris TaxID=451379 RepID=A0A0N5AGK4_9BILA
MSLGGIYRDSLWQLFTIYLILLGCHAQVSQATVLFGDAPPTKGSNRDLPAIATAFVQTGNELHYFSDVQYHEDLIGGAPVKSTDESEPVLNNQLQFSPKELSFGEQALGVPHQQKVSVRNPTASTVRFDAISGSTIHFHCSFPEHKIVNPEEETSFDVIFLPRQEGAIENVLFVHSSLGTFTYTVRGTGSGNPYRIRPLIGAKVPLNGTFVSAVQLYNPHSTTLRVKEMYTSGGDVHLELPDTAPDKVHASSLWEIAPYQTKIIMNAKLLAAHERNATAYIKIKTDLKRKKSNSKEQEEIVKSVDESFEDTLIVPVEVEITRKRGLFSTSDVLDFGLVRIGERTGHLTLEVVSTLDKGLEIEVIWLVLIVIDSLKSNSRIIKSLYVAEKGTDDPSGIYMEFASKPPIAIKCGAMQQPGAPKAIAKVTFDTKLVRIPPGTKYMRYRGKITAESRSGNYNISVPYVATMYSGTLIPDVDDTTFLSYVNPPASHAVTLKNTLPFGVTIWNVTIDDAGKGVFLVKLLTRVVAILPGESRPALWLRYLKKKPDGFTSYVTLRTNVTTFYIPVSVYDGKLKITLYSLDQTLFDFGLMSMHEQKTILFAITNKNPMPVVIRRMKRGLPLLTKLTLKGIEAGNKTILTDSALRNWSKVWQQGMEFVVPGRGFAVFNYTLTSPLDHVLLRDTFEIETDFQSLTYPVKYGIEEGTVAPVPERLSFPESFPFKIGYQTLQLYSTFKRDMRVLRLSTLSRDPRVHFEVLSNDQMPVLKSNRVSYLGRVQFRSNATCGENNCYLGINLQSGEGQWFTYGMKLPQNLAEIDTYLYKRLRKRWYAMQAQGRHIINETIIVDTDEVQHIPIPVSGEMVWPKLLTRSVVHFPLTAVGNFTIMNLTLQNPASTSIVVQLLPLVIYPEADNLVDFFRDSLDSPLTEPVEMNETLMFSLRDTELFTLKSDSPVPVLREQLQEIVGQQIPKFTLSMLLRPGMKVRIRVGFLPNDYTLRSSLLLIRNNLTVIEPIVLYGKGSRIDMKVEGQSARSGKPLTFEIQKHHLTDCYNPKRLVHKLNTTLTVKRSFTVVNTGEVTFTVVNMSINYLPCENRGFRILNCHPFRLAPNESYVLDIAYTPDFLMSWNEAALQFFMHMNSTSWMFLLGASVPFDMLAKCHSALPRPNVEWLIYYFAVAFLASVCIWAWSYLEGERAVEEAIKQQFSHSLKLFDLNAVEASGKGKLDNRRGTVLLKQETANGSKQLTRDFILSCPDDANIFAKLFWEVAGYILWLFSQLWWFHRVERAVPSIVKNTTIKSRRCRAMLFKSIKDSLPSKEVKESRSVESVSNSNVPSPISGRVNNRSSKTAVTEVASAQSNTLLNSVHSSAPQKIQKSGTRLNRNKILNPHQSSTHLTAIHQNLTRNRGSYGSSTNTHNRKSFQPVDAAVNTERIPVAESSSDALRSSPALTVSIEEKDKRKGKLIVSDREEKSRVKRANAKQGNLKIFNGDGPILTQKPLLKVGTEVHFHRNNYDVADDHILKDSAKTTVMNSHSEKSITDYMAQNDWSLSNAENVDTKFDARSETGFSDASATPEWDTFTSPEGNVDDDYDAIYNDTTCFDSQVKIAELSSVSSASCPPNNSPFSKRNSRKKRVYGNSKISNTSSRSTSLSSVEETSANTYEAFMQRRSHLHLQNDEGAGTIGNYRHPERTQGLSPFMNELQKERRQREDEHRKKKGVLTEENWPGLNLKFPVLDELYVSGEVEDSHSSRWPLSRNSMTDHTSDVKESVLKFRLNPKAQPFVYNTAHYSKSDLNHDCEVTSGMMLPSSSAPLPPVNCPTRPESSPAPPLSSPIGNLSSAPGPSSDSSEKICEGLLNDPLGYSGSLFQDSLNIWAAKSASLTDEPVLWAEKFLAEQDEKFDIQNQN